jgi:hypothetical protein
MEPAAENVSSPVKFAALVFELPLVVEFIGCIAVDELVLLLLTTESAGWNMLSKDMAAKRKIASTIDIARLTILIKC